MNQTIDRPMTLPGFTDSATDNAIAIWCNQNRARTWYYRNESGDNQELPDKLVGKLTGIELWETGENSQYPGAPKISFKLLSGEQPYSLICGRDSGFAKGMIGAIVSATPEQLAGLVTIRARNGDKALLCSVYSGQDWLPGLKDWRGQDWEALIKQAIGLLNQPRRAPVYSNRQAVAAATARHDINGDDW